MIFKYAFYLIVFIVAIYIYQYVFNHIDAWAGIGILAIIVVFTINFLYQQIKKQTKK